MNGVINNFRMSRHRQKMNHIIITVDGITDKTKADTLKGKNVIWISPSGKELTGQVAGAHGNKGRIRAIFNIGIPGQALGQRVKVGE